MKGDGWAVKRYLCPRCNKKGLYIKYHQAYDGMCKMGCMYKKCPSNESMAPSITWDEVYKSNPELINEPVKYKA